MAYSMATTRDESEHTKKIHSLDSGILYMIIFSVLLWWMPVFGPAMAGYLGGRKAGNMKNGFFASLAVAGLFIIISLSLFPYRSGFLYIIGRYIEYGILPLSNSGIVSVSNFSTYIYSYAGFVYTFFILVPSSIAILIIFALIGGFMTSLRMQESPLKKDAASMDEDEEKIDEEDSKYDYL